MASSLPVRTVFAVALAIALVGGAVAFGGVVAQDLQQDANQQDADELNNVNESDRQQTSFFRVVHASPDAPAVNVTVDNETVLSGVEFGAVSDYRSLEAGTYNVTIASATDPDTVVFDDEVTFDPRSVTTVSASGEISEGAETAFEPIAFEDDGLTPADNESALSVVHLSPDAPAVDVTTGNGSVVLAENVSFRNASDYVTVPAGNYTAEIRPATADNNGSIVTTVDVSLEGGTAYSAFAVGYLNPDDAPADTPFEAVLSEDATLTVELPGDRAMDDEDETEDDAETDDDSSGDADDSNDDGDSNGESTDESDGDEGGDEATDDDSPESGESDGGTDGESGGSDDSSADDSDDESDGESEGENDSDESDSADDTPDSDDDGDSGDSEETDDSDGTDDTENADSSIRSIEECSVIQEPGTYQLDQDLTNQNGLEVELRDDYQRSVCIAIQSSGVVLEGNGHLLAGSGASGSVGVHMYDPGGSPVDNVTVRNLQVEGWSNGIQVGVDTWAVNPAGPATAHLENVESSDNGNHGFFVASAGTQLSSVTATENGGSGIGIMDSSGLTIEDATLTDNEADGINLFEGVFDSTFRDVTATNNGEAGLYAGVDVTGNEFIDLIVADNGETDFEGFDGTDNEFDDLPEDTNETDEASDSEEADENEDDSGNETDVDDGTDAGNQTEADDGDETEAGNQTDADDGTDAGNQTDVDDGTDVENDTDADNGDEGGNETDVDDETEAGDETDVDGGADAGNQTAADDGGDAGDQTDADGGTDAGNDTDADDGTDAGNETDAEGGTEGGDEAGDVNEST